MRMFDVTSANTNRSTGGSELIPAQESNVEYVCMYACVLVYVYMYLCKVFNVLFPCIFYLTTNNRNRVVFLHQNRLLIQGVAFAINFRHLQ